MGKGSVMRHGVNISKIINKQININININIYIYTHPQTHLLSSPDTGTNWSEYWSVAKAKVRRSV